jgi:HSP20 family protein
MRVPSNSTRRRSASRNSTSNLIDSIFKDMEKNLLSKRGNSFGKTDIYEKDGSIFYEMELPGLNKEDVKVEKREDKLVVSGKAEKDSEGEERNYLSRGRRYGKFQHSFPLPDLDEADKIDANFENGILEVRVPLEEKKEEKGTVKIEIE